MATNTSRLGLLKKDTATDGNDTFNIKTMLNDNWDKIDAKVATLGPDGKVPAEQLSITAPADASTSQKGVVQLEDSVTSTSVTKAATAKSVKTVNDALDAHKTDFTNLAIGKKITLNVTSDYAGKVVNSTVENPNIAKYAYQSTLQPPNSSLLSEQEVYSLISTFDGALDTRQRNQSGIISQRIFYFDIIEILTRKYGVEIFGGATTLTEKIAKARTIITNITCNWWGFGSGTGGNKATVKAWASAFSGWYGNVVSNTSNTPTLLKSIITSVSSYIDSNGFVYFIAYAEPSDGTTVSVINTDYVSLDITVSVSALADVKSEVAAHQTDLSSQESGKGASLIGINDSGNKFTATNVEGALQELGQAFSGARGSLITSTNGLLGS